MKKEVKEGKEPKEVNGLGSKDIELSPIESEVEIELCKLRSEKAKLQIKGYDGVVSIVSLLGGILDIPEDLYMYYQGRRVRLVKLSCSSIDDRVCDGILGMSPYCKATFVDDSGKEYLQPLSKLSFGKDSICFLEELWEMVKRNKMAK